MTAGAAASLARLVFPTVLDQPHGGPPPLPAGVHVAQILSPFAEQVDLRDGSHAVVESVGPLATPTSPGHYSPINLALTAARGEYAPTTTDAPVLIPRRLREGVRTENGVVLTPITQQGAPLNGSEGTITGATVFYANTQTDTDTVVAPTSGGYAIDALLRSQRSPSQFHYHLTLPSGARLLPPHDGTGPIEIVRGGIVIAAVLPPVAEDAAGSPVPVAMHAHGDNIALSFGRVGEAYQYPVAVDPELVDSEVTGHKKPTRWKFGPENPAHFTDWGFGTEYYLEIESSGEYKAGEGAYLEYQTQGDSHIYWVGTYLKVQNEGKVEATLRLAHYNGSTEEHEDLVVVAPTESEVFEKTYFNVCAEHPTYPTCPTEGTWKEYGAEHNFVMLEESATASGSGYNHANLYETNVFIKQNLGPEQPEFNKTEEYLKNDSNRRNVLYGSGSWLSSVSGGYEVKARDKGIGVSKLLVEGLNTGFRKTYEYLAENLCEGVQCRPEVSQAFTYSSDFENGEVTVEAEDEDAAVEFARGHATIKVDNTAPFGIRLSGMAEEGAELSNAPHEFSVDAYEGQNLYKSSGIKSIAVTIDGKEIGQPHGSCSTSLGVCSAHSVWTIAGETLGAGVHTMVVSVTSNAGVEAKREITFGIRDAGALKIGPGSFNMASGQMELSATDATFRGIGGVARSYNSRELEAGGAGPLGPQWSVSLGSGETLRVLANQDAMLIGASGGMTQFTHEENGEFQSPTGDSSLKLEFEPAKHVFLLKDAGRGTTMTFTQEGIESTAPFLVGGIAAEADELALPVADTIDKTGDVWVTNYGSGRIKKFSAYGSLLGTYGGEGTAGGDFNGPWGIAISPSSGDVYVSDLKNQRIEVLSSSGAFLKAFGWGVANGKSELETCETGCEAGIAGSGLGQVSNPHGLAVDATGDVWVADCNNNRIEEFSSSGAYLGQIGTYGSGAGQMSCPAGIAFADGNLYVADYGNNRIDEFNEAGEKFVQAFGFGVENGEAKLQVCTTSCKTGIAGSEHGQLNGPNEITANPKDGNLYVADINNNRVEEFTGAGAFVNTFGTKGKGPGQFESNGPQDVAVNPDGLLYATDTNNNRLAQYNRSTWVATISEEAGATAGQSFIYRSVQVEGKTVIEPVEELGPKPYGVTCSSEPAKAEKGCRMLTFQYAEHTKENIGESPSEWGEYAGRLVKVLFTAYNPATGKMAVETPVAEYAYDKQGRLRAEWDPRITPALKTTYGYDSEGHVTAINAPGQQPWLMHYGTTPTDPGAGRLLSVIRPAASTTLASGAAPQNTAAPTLSSTKPRVGAKVSVSSPGTWNSSPLAYTYQWEDCNTSGGECTAISGAVNASYYPKKSDEGYALAARVTAYNSTGAVAEASAHTSAVTSGTESNPAPEAPNAGKTSVWTVEYQVPVWGTGAPHEMTASKLAEWGQKDDPSEATAVFPPDEPMGWPAKDYARATVSYRDSVGRTVNLAYPDGGIVTTEYNSNNAVTRTLSADNRAAALKEGCKSETECQSATEASLLSTENTFNSEGTELTETLGPAHTVRPAKATSTVSAHQFTKYYYDEGAPGGETYHLLTKTETGGLNVATHEEFDVRTTTTGYGGQGDLGWTLRKPTEVTTDPNGLKLKQTTDYDRTTGHVIETTQPEGNENSSESYNSSFGSAGSEPGKLQYPSDLAIDSKGNYWIVDRYNDRIEEFNSKGEYASKEFGAKGTANGDFEYPQSIAIDSKGNFWITDSGNNRVEEFNEKGTWVQTVGSKGTEPGKFEDPWGIAIDSHGNVWVTDSGNNRVEEFNEKGGYEKTFGSVGTGNEQFESPEGIAIDESGNLWIADSRYYRVKEFSSTGVYKATIGNSKEMVNPTGVAIDARDNLWVVERGSSRVQEYSLEGDHFESKFGEEGSGPGQFKLPEGLAVKSLGDETEVFLVDTSNSRIEKWTSTFGSPLDQRTFYYTPKGESEVSSCANHPEWAGLPCETAPAGQPETPNMEQLPVTATTYNMWGAPETVTEQVGTNKRTKKETFDAAGRETAGETTSALNTVLPKVIDEYNSQTGALEKQNTELNGKTKTITAKENSLTQLTEYTDAEGNVAKYTYEEPEEDRTTTYSGGSGVRPEAVATGPEGDLWFTAFEAAKLGRVSPSGQVTEYSLPAGSGPRAITTGPEGVMWFTDADTNKVGKINPSSPSEIKEYAVSNISGLHGIVAGPGHEDALWVAGGEGKIDKLSPSGTVTNEYSVASGPIDIAVGQEGDIWFTNGYASKIGKVIPGSGEVKEYSLKSAPQPWGLTVGPEGDLWYTGSTGSTIGNFNPSSDESTEYSLPSGSFPVSITAGPDGNLWFTQPGRNSIGKITPSGTRTEYKQPENSRPYGIATGSEGRIWFTDREGDKISSLALNGGGDGRLIEVAEGKGEEAKSKQTYGYDPTSGYMTRLTDSSAGTFTAAYSPEGRMLTEGYPNGMTATYAYNATGAGTALEYDKTTHCSEHCTWFSEYVTPAIHGEALTRSGTFGEANYTYNAAAELTEVQETPSGKGCKVRLYTYNEDGDRLSLTSREPASENKCATTGGTVGAHSYDSAGRMLDPGVSYETFGNTTALPSSDAGGYEMTSTYYSDGQLAMQVQKKTALAFAYDPSGRTMETVTENQETKEKATAISHYAASGGGVTWTSEGTGKWTRNVPGIGGSLVATQASGKEAVLQLHNLGGSIVATAAMSETETKLLTTYDPTEFGVPSEGEEPHKYGWLGAFGAASELDFSGTLTMSGRAYVPQIARDLQTDQVTPPGAFPDGTGPGAPYTTALSPEVTAAGSTFAAGAPTREAERQAVSAEEACRANMEVCDPLLGAIVWKYEYLDEHEVFGVWVSLEQAGTKEVIFLKKIQAFFEKGPVNFVKKELGDPDAPTDWLIIPSEGIYHCAEAMIADDALFGTEQNSPERCEFSLPFIKIEIATPEVSVNTESFGEWRVGGKLFSLEAPDFLKDPIVSYCTDYEQHCGSWNGQEFVY